MGLAEWSLDMTGEGINIALDALAETAVEVSTAEIAKYLNSIKFSGKGNWTDRIIESYIDNLKSNLQTAITANIIHRRISKLQNNNHGYYVKEKIRSAFVNFRGGQ